MRRSKLRSAVAWLVGLLAGGMSGSASGGEVAALAAAPLPRPRPLMGAGAVIESAQLPAPLLPLTVTAAQTPIESRVLDRPLEAPPMAADFVPAAPVPPNFRYPTDPTLGFACKSGVLPTVVQGDADFVPVEDRWRLGMPSWDRYGKGHPLLDDYPYDLGTFWNPYQLNVLKGDYPILGQHTFFNFTADEIYTIEGRQVPTGTTPFESTARAGQIEFFGSPNQLVNNQFLFLSFDLFHGDASFKPVDWRVVITPAINFNQLNVDELAVVNPDVRKGTQRQRIFTTLQEYFFEYKIADLSPNYDFVSVRVGSQPFVSDFRGFLFSDVNRAVRLFGNANSNRDQFNVAIFRQAEKDTNSSLNTLEDRDGQTIFIANWYHQDFIFPGYTIQGSFHFDHDPNSFRFDRNNFLVRPDPTGDFTPHNVDVAYLGLAGDGHIGRYNLTHQVYWAIGHDSLNPLANQPQDISAGMAAVELSYDRDWARFKTSFFWSSGDHNIANHHATGFDTILDNPNFAGGPFSYWQREAIQLFGVKLVNALSLVPDLRASKIQGQANFVNPGLVLVNFGIDSDLTPKLKWVNNLNFLWFETTQVLRQFTFDGNIDTRIGTDISTGMEYRPLLSNNVIMVLGVSTLIPGSGFKSLYDNPSSTISPPVAAFMTMNLNF
jgi:hypothetical protein